MWIKNFIYLTSWRIILTLLWLSANVACAYGIYLLGLSLMENNIPEPSILLWILQFIFLFGFCGIWTLSLWTNSRFAGLDLKDKAHFYYLD